MQSPVVGGQGALDHVGDAACALLAVATLALAVRRARHQDWCLGSWALRPRAWRGEARFRSTTSAAP